MKKHEIKKLLGISDENFDFYVEMGAIRKAGRNKFVIDPEMRSRILEKGTVFKYSYDDSFTDDIREYINVVKYTGKVRRYTKKELEEYNKKKKEEKK